MDASFNGSDNFYSNHISGIEEDSSEIETAATDLGERRHDWFGMIALTRYRCPPHQILTTDSVQEKGPSDSWSRMVFNISPTATWSEKSRKQIPYHVYMKEAF